MSWPGGNFTCSCTNQCPQCGACCAVGCEHRGTGRVVVTDHTNPLPPLTPIPLPTNAFFGASAPHVFHEQVREIVREELDLTVERIAGALIKGLPR